MPAPKGNMSVTLEGKGPVTLKPGDHIATGGEGSIYKISGYAVKMYLKPDEMRAAGLPMKIQLLARLKHPYIGAPQGLVLNSSQEPVGHYLPFVDGHALSLVFTKDFWTKEGFDVAKSSALVARIREVFEFAHDHGALLVDPNELNWFNVLPANEPRVIDVDSWVFENNIPQKVPKMPSIRDWHGKSASRESDWFAWGIVTFQIYTGVHPYKGTLDGYDRKDLMGRMKANASVFTPGVKLNIAVRDFATIPGPLRSWYEATFQQGARSKPPAPDAKDVTAAPAARVLRTVVGGAGSLTLEKIFSVPGDPVIKAFHCGVVQTKSGRLHDLATKRELCAAPKNCEVVQTSRGWLVGDKDGFRHIGTDMKQTSLPLPIHYRQLISYEDRMFAVTEAGLSEINVKFFGDPVASVGSVPFRLMVNSTRWFRGMGILDAMGAMFLVLPYGKESIVNVRVKELDGMKTLVAKSGNRFVSLVAVDRNGDYHKFEFTFDKDYGPPKVWQSVADDAGLNLAILPKGVCATIFKDGELDIFVPSNGAVRHIDDRQIATDMELGNWRDVVLFIQNGDVWTLKVK